MALSSVRVPVLNSLLFVRDAGTENIPKIDGKSAVWSTDSCVAISCLPDCDGETEITIGPSREMGERGGKLLFDGRLATPSRSVIVESVLRKIITQKNGPR